MSDTYRGADYDQDEAEEARKKIVKNAHKLLDRAEQIIDHITKNGEENVDNDWKKVIIDGEEKLMRKVEMQSDLVEAIKAHKTANTEKQDLIEEEKKRNEETKVVPQDGFFEFKK